MLMKNIVLVNTEENWGGGEHWFYEVAVALQKDPRIAVWVMTHPEGRLSARLREANVGTVPCSVSLADLLNPSKQKKWRTFFESHHIECILFNTPTEAKVLGAAAYKAGVRRRILRRGSALPVRDSLPNKWLLKKYITHLLTNSYWTARLLQEESSCVAGLPVKVIHNGVPKARLWQSPTYREQPPLKIGSVGRLSPEKGHKDLLELAEYLIQDGMEVEVHIAGDGAERPELERLIRQKHLQQKVFLHGFVTQPVLFMQEIDVLVHTARWEGFGFVLVEAMAQGRPVIAYDAGSTGEIVEHGKTGFIVPMGEVEQLAEAVRMLRSPARRHMMGIAAIERVRQCFLWENKLEEILHYLLFE
ncbi:MAG: glycosyl transferase [Thermonema sp.]|nr:MAG: glycosyl transferase [Thermonema sp.]